MRTQSVDKRSHRRKLSLRRREVLAATMAAHHEDMAKRSRWLHNRRGMTPAKKIRAYRLHWPAKYPLKDFYPAYLIAATINAGA